MRIESLRRRFRSLGIGQSERDLKKLSRVLYRLLFDYRILNELFEQEIDKQILGGHLAPTALELGHYRKFEWVPDTRYPNAWIMQTSRPSDLAEIRDQVLARKRESAINKMRHDAYAELKSTLESRDSHFIDELGKARARILEANPELEQQWNI